MSESHQSLAAPERALVQTTSINANGERYQALLHEVCHGNEIDMPELLERCEEQMVFVTGLAGSGKTASMKRWLSMTKRKVIVCAPTGVAALLCGGTTIHRAFSMPITIMDDAAIEQCAMRQRKAVKFADTLVIDECSMVLPSMLDIISKILQRARRNSRLPFGGMQVILFGDPYQLPPVSRDEEWSIINRNNEYSTQFFFSSKVLKAFPPVMFNLTKLFRQSEQESEFIEILNAVRSGSIGDELLEKLNKRVRPDFGNVPGYVYIAATNREVDIINRQHLDSLPGTELVYESKVDGDFNPKDAPCDSPLRLKIGAQVMITANEQKPKDSENDKDDDWKPSYVNGTVGEVVAIGDAGVSIKTDSGIVFVGSRTWEKVKYEVQPFEDGDKIVSQATGHLIQFPLRIAAAITAHKTQGQSLDKVIIDSRSIFENGQLYVALSRCRTLNNLVLKTPVTRRAVMTASGVSEWYESLRSNGRLLDVRQEFIGRPDDAIAKAAASPLTVILEKLSTGDFLSNEAIQEVKAMPQADCNEVAIAGIQVFLDEIVNLRATVEAMKKKTKAKTPKAKLFQY